MGMGIQCSYHVPHYSKVANLRAVNAPLTDAAEKPDILKPMATLGGKSSIGGILGSRNEEVK